MARPDMLKPTATTRRRTALTLLLCLCFQSGVAFGSVFAGTAAGFSVLCRNGALATADTDGADRQVTANLPCLACTQSGDDDPLASQSVRGDGELLPLATASPEHRSLVPSTSLRQHPPARAPPATVCALLRPI